MMRIHVSIDRFENDYVSKRSYDELKTKLDSANDRNQSIANENAWRKGAELIADDEANKLRAELSAARAEIEALKAGSVKKYEPQKYNYELLRPMCELPDDDRLVEVICKQKQRYSHELKLWVDPEVTLLCWRDFPETCHHKWITQSTGSRRFDAASGSVEDDLDEQVVCSVCGCVKPEQPPSAEPTEQPPF